MIAFRDPLFDGQLRRAIAHGTYGGAELGECLATAAKIASGDRASWLAAWMALADRTCAVADASARGGHRTSARSTYLRASNYYRTAYIFHLEAPLPAAVTTAYRGQRETFALAAAAMTRPFETLTIPFEDAPLSGYFASAGDGARPVVISVGGYDSTAEESYFFNGAAALARGYHAVLFDGPGQGAQLIEHGVPFRPDWERALAALLDVVAARPDVDASRIAVIGESFGGFLAPRAAAHDRRIAALVLDPPQLDLFGAALARIPLPQSLKADLPRGPRWVVALLRAVLGRMARRPTAGWALRRGMLTHGVATPWDYIVDSARYRQAPVADIRCPVLACDAADDDISAFARPFFDRLTGDKTLVRFTAEDGAADHCVMGNRSLYHARVFDWLDTRLGATRGVIDRTATDRTATPSRN